MENLKLTLLTIFTILVLSGCTRYHARIGEAEIDMFYFLQDKAIKSFSYNAETHTITIENFGSETSQIVETAIKTALINR